MVRNTDSIIGSYKETIFGTRDQDAPDSTELYYKPGSMNKQIPFPDVDMDLIKRYSYASHDPNSIEYGRAKLDFKPPLNYTLIDGTSFYRALGANSTVDADPTWTHTITRVPPGTQMPSFTWHVENYGAKVASTEPRYVDFCGCITKHLSVTVGTTQNNPQGAIVQESILASSYIDHTADANPAAVLTTKPVFRTDGKTTAYKPYYITADSDVNVRTADIGAETKVVSIAIDTPLIPNYPIRGVLDSYYTSIYTDRWVDSIDINVPSIALVLQIDSGNVNTEDLWDAVTQMALDNAAILKLARSDTDYIECTFSATNAPVENVTQLCPKLGESEDHVAYLLRPKDLTVVVKNGMTEAMFET